MTFTTDILVPTTLHPVRIPTPTGVTAARSLPTRRSSDLPRRRSRDGAALLLGCGAARPHPGADLRDDRGARAPEDLEGVARSEEHTSELQSRGHRVCRLLVENETNAACASPHTRSPTRD